MSDTALTTEQIAAIRGRLTAVRTKKPVTQAYWTALSVWRANAADDIDALLTAYEAAIARIAELESQTVQAAKVILDTRELLEASEKYMGDNAEQWFKTQLREILRGDAPARRLRGIAPAVNVAAGQDGD